LKEFPNVLFVHEPRKNVRISRDPFDDMFIGCALHLKASVVVSGDKDLLAIGRSFENSFLTPRQFLDSCMGHR